MNQLRRFRYRLRCLLSRERREQELDEELRFHLEAEAEERMGDGLSPAEAEFAARRSLGNALQIREEARMNWIWAWPEQLLRDVRYGWRQLVKTKATSAAAILSLALVIGATTAVFRFVDALLLRPLPVTGAERLYGVSFDSTRFDGTPFLYDSCAYPLFSRMRTAVGGKVTTEAFAMVLIGAIVGLGIGLTSERYLATLLYGVKTTDLTMLAVPFAAILGAAALASVLPVIRAVQVDPIKMLCVE